MRVRDPMAGHASGVTRWVTCAVAFCSLVPTSVTAAPAYLPTLTGEQFIAAIIHNKVPTGNDYVEREKAYGYLDGLRDYTEGRDWCDVDQLKTHDLAQALAIKLRSLAPADLKRNASRLLLEQLGRMHPCPRGSAQ